MSIFYGDATSYADDLVWANVWISLSIKRGNWFANPSFGSRLHLVKTASDASLDLARQYAAEALAWMVDAGRAKKIEVTVVRADVVGRIDITVNITKTNDKTAFYTFFKRVI